MKLEHQVPNEDNLDETRTWLNIPLRHHQGMLHGKLRYQNTAQLPYKS